MKGWGYWDYVNAGEMPPEPFSEGWSDYCETIQEAADAYRQQHPKPLSHLAAAKCDNNKCLVCGVELTGKRNGARTCGPKCRKALSRRAEVNEMED